MVKQSEIGLFSTLQNFENNLKKLELNGYRKWKMKADLIIQKISNCEKKKIKNADFETY